MSLINDALKRAESDKVQRSSPYFDNLTVLPPADEEYRPSMLPPETRPPKRRSPASYLMALSLIVAAGLTGWYVWTRFGDSGRPKSARADAPAATARAGPQTQPATVRTAKAAPRPVTPKPTPAEATTTKPARKPVMPRVASAVGELLARAKRLAPTALPATQPSPPRPKPTPKPAPAVKPPSPPKPAPIKIVAGPRQPVRSARPTPPRRKTKVNPGRFRLSAIMRGPGGGAALINGFMLRVGQEIDGAKIVRIDQYSVELELDGQRFTIQMSR